MKKVLNRGHDTLEYSLTQCILTDSFADADAHSVPVLGDGNCVCADASLGYSC
jgi:hypothetical protein